jgi:ribonuclease D
MNRFDKLHLWRKHTASKRGVESDVIISKEALWAIAQKNPKNEAQLEELEAVGAWRCKTYGQDILDVLRNG